jgi:hypothetical protein
MPKERVAERVRSLASAFLAQFLHNINLVISFLVCHPGFIRQGDSAPALPVSWQTGEGALDFVLPQEPEHALHNPQYVHNDSSISPPELRVSRLPTEQCDITVSVLGSPLRVPS